MFHMASGGIIPFSHVNLEARREAPNNALQSGLRSGVCLTHAQGKSCFKAKLKAIENLKLTRKMKNLPGNPSDSAEHGAIQAS